MSDRRSDEHRAPQLPRASAADWFDAFEDWIDGGYHRERQPQQPRPQPAQSPQQHTTTRPETPASDKKTSNKPESDKPASNAPQPQVSSAESPMRSKRLAELEAEVRACRLCALGSQRTNAVPGMGVLDPLIMVIGEAPGANEDAQGKPFVGRAGQYLDKWLQSIDLSRDTNVYIGNIIKCRPPNNRDPRPDEIAACYPYLLRQLKIVRPRMLLIVGRIAAQTLLETKMSLGNMRGQIFHIADVPTVVTYHPSAVLRNPQWRRPVWDDLRFLRSSLNAQQ